MSIGTLSAAHNELENVKTLSLAYYADTQEWLGHIGSTYTGGNYSLIDCRAKVPKTSYHFDINGFIDSIGNPKEIPTTDGVHSHEYAGIMWEDVDPGTMGPEQWVKHPSIKP